MDTDGGADIGTHALLTRTKGESSEAKIGHFTTYIISFQLYEEFLTDFVQKLKMGKFKFGVKIKSTQKHQKHTS